MCSCCCIIVGDGVVAAAAANVVVAACECPVNCFHVSPAASVSFGPGAGTALDPTQLPEINFHCFLHLPVIPIGFGLGAGGAGGLGALGVAAPLPPREPFASPVLGIQNLPWWRPPAIVTYGLVTMGFFFTLGLGATTAPIIDFAAMGCVILL